MSQPKAEFDTPWKKILDIYFEDFVSYCWPERHAEIDWQKGYTSLDKELSKISRNAPVTNRIIDKLIEVCLKNGEEAYVLVHLEVQGQSDTGFEPDKQELLPTPTLLGTQLASFPTLRSGQCKAMLP